MLKKIVTVGVTLLLALAGLFALPTTANAVTPAAVAAHKAHKGHKHHKHHKHHKAHKSNRRVSLNATPLDNGKIWITGSYASGRWAAIQVVFVYVAGGHKVTRKVSSGDGVANLYAPRNTTRIMVRLANSGHWVLERGPFVLNVETPNFS